MNRRTFLASGGLSGAALITQAAAENDPNMGAQNQDATQPTPLSPEQEIAEWYLNPESFPDLGTPLRFMANETYEAIPADRRISERELRHLINSSGFKPIRIITPKITTDIYDGDATLSLEASRPGCVDAFGVQEKIRQLPAMTVPSATFPVNSYVRSGGPPVRIAESARSALASLVAVFDEYPSKLISPIQICVQTKAFLVEFFFYAHVIPKNLAEVLR